MWFQKAPLPGVLISGQIGTGVKQRRTYVSVFCHIVRPRRTCRVTSILSVLTLSGHESRERGGRMGGRYIRDDDRH